MFRCYHEHEVYSYDSNNDFSVKYLNILEKLDNFLNLIFLLSFVVDYLFSVFDTPSCT